MTIANRLITCLTPPVLLLAAPLARAQTVVYYHTDALGSVVAVTDANRTVIEKNEYEPYGKVVNHALQDGPGYAGHVADAQTGLIYMQQRYYDDDLGEFPTVDPVTATSVGGNFNRYWYANNNPYRFVDPDGRKPEDNSPPPQDCGDQPCPSRREKKEQRDREQRSDIVLIRSQTTVLGNVTVSGAGDTDGIARATATPMREFTAITNQEACANFCPIFNGEGYVTGYSAQIVTQGSRAWCVAMPCGGGAMSHGQNHTHSFRPYIGTALDVSRNDAIRFGQRNPPGLVFSSMDKGVTNIYLTTERNLFNYLNGKVRKLP
ncbi:hypothetical protein M2650_11525 [Luteimonas sp. SX5]|uniref:Teneurin-like YD-shell domain-containing protein n=1 Tax=Luteimonas galliterrae TaxID=2940486 RepID=A0ABT0MK59_9GAMM|nr:RHS repeat-associated core domain-containing protein [Luteimonas galliterrae]MCL1635255.1 hypothetical protein [Luteimonas galliterrae]